MSLTPSNMLPLGVLATDFTLIDTQSEQELNLFKHVQDSPFVIAFICNHCPFVVHIVEKMAQLFNQYQAKGIKVVAISSNDITTHPDDAPDKMAEFAKMHRFSFPYCYDATQAIAKAYQAACTPDLYLFNVKAELVYRGRFDDSTPGNNKPVTGIEIVQAMNALLNNEPIDQNQKPSMGCNIKWQA